MGGKSFITVDDDPSLDHLDSSENTDDDEDELQAANLEGYLINWLCNFVLSLIHLSRFLHSLDISFARLRPPEFAYFVAAKT